MEWSTGVTSGTVEATDLIDLSFTLFGGDTSSGFAEIFRDDAIIGGAPQPLGGDDRTICGTSPCDIEYEFDHDAFATDATSGVVGFSTGLPSTIEFNDGFVYSFFCRLGGEVYVDAFIDGDGVTPLSSFSNVPSFSTVATVQPIPLPAPALMLLSALGAAAVAGRRKAG